MECNNCGNDKAHAWRLNFDQKIGFIESCDRCGNVSANSAAMPDVFWNGPGYHPGLVGKDNKPIFITTRQQKARLMKEQNTREAGDLHHGMRGTEFAHVARRTNQVNPNVLKLKKIFQDHERSI